MCFLFLGFVNSFIFQNSNSLANIIVSLLHDILEPAGHLSVVYWPCCPYSYLYSAVLTDAAVSCPRRLIRLCSRFTQTTLQLMY